VHGTNEERVRIIPAGTEAWGSLACVRATGISHVRHLYVRGGSEAWQNGLFLSGQLCFYHSDVEMQNCVISDASADDGLNVKKAHLKIQNCAFINNSADSIDADWTTGSIGGCVFLKSRGDGLDFSGSQVAVHDCVFSGSLDKGVSVGERSDILIFNSVLRSNGMGVASKDLSQVRIYASVLYDNQIGVSLYRKKQLFGGSVGSAIGTLFWKNGRNIEVDAESNFEIVASAVDSWDENSRVTNSHLLRGPVEEYYRVTGLADVLHTTISGTSPFLVPVETEQASFNGVEVPQLAGRPAGLAHPLNLQPWTKDQMEESP